MDSPASLITGRRQEKVELVDNWNLVTKVNKVIRIMEANGLHLPASL